MATLQSKFLAKSAVALAVASALAVGAWTGHMAGAANASTTAPAAASVPAQGTPQSTASNMLVPNFSAIVAAEGPAVVNISVSGTAKIERPQFPGLDPDDPFFPFFRHFGIPRGPQAPQSERHTEGMGSGLIVSTDGIVLTNAHVVDGADEVTVKLTDKREFKAKVLGVDKATDVAVLRIPAKDLPTVRIGDPQKARVGDWVLAIGAPFGFENSATAGIISAKSRSLPDENYVPFLQTDVAINPGNSGGPLFNLNGEVIGVNSQIYSRSGGYQGLSFAIPIDVAMKVERQIVDHGRVSRGKLGVAIQSVDQGLAESFGLNKAQGALVAEVEPGSAAENAGMKPGDVILRFNGKDIASSSDLPSLVADVAPGSTAKVDIWRQGKTQELSITVGEVKQAQAKTAGKSDSPAGRLGVAVRPLTAEEKRDSGLSGGLLVQDSRGPAAFAGIRQGDVILAVNGTPVANVEQLRGLIAKSGKRMALLIQRADQKMFVAIQLN
jgi:serine protease Do